ncbi:YheU family protein [Motiliproteus sediminis]|uniref:YheU family protein n=1 Tax=Motiliproteus sediminis TaxID=1468178 RepID=UPI001AEF623B|nr:YheU family protein [Motiliproteus sediminis]
MEIPWRELSPEALDGLIEEFVTREGTDYGHQDYSLDDKVAQVRRQLECGEAVILFDSYLQSCTLERRSG